MEAAPNETQAKPEAAADSPEPAVESTSKSKKNRAQRRAKNLIASKIEKSSDDVPSEQKAESKPSLLESLGTKNTDDKEKDIEVSSTETQDESAETEASIAELSEDEIEIINQQLAQSRLAELEADSEEEDGGQADIAAVHELLTRIADGEDADRALDETLINHAPQSETGSDDLVAEQDENMAVQPEQPPAETADVENDNEPPRRPPVPPTTESFGEPEPEDANDQPTVPPVIPLQTQPQAGPRPRRGFAEMTAVPDGVNRYEQANPAATALVGGIVGYLIGRRRGRIKTEKKLLPIQKKLEKQVEDLSWELKRKEDTVRKVMVNRFAPTHTALESKQIVSVQEQVQISPVENEAVTMQKPELVFDRPVEVRAMPLTAPPETVESEAILRRVPAAEAHELHGKQRSEHLGQMLVAEAITLPVVAAAAAIEARREAQAAERPVPKAEASPKPEITEKQVETLNRSELLGLSDTIIVEGSSLRQAYENNLIGEKGLRRLVAEHLRGGDVKTLLRREMVERQIDFERDPILRDKPSSGSQTANGGAGGTQQTDRRLDALLEKAGVKTAEEQRSYERDDKQEVDDKKQSLMDVGLVTTIAVLVAIIVVVLLSR